MIFRTICVDNTFNAGLAIGSLRARAAGNGFGSVDIVGRGDKCVTVELVANSAEIMAYMERELAAYV